MSIVERLRVIAKAISEEDWRELSMRVPAEPERDADLVVMKAADLIEQQAERIKELEAEIGIGHLQCIADRQKYKQELAALRQRIADAPVVAWLHTQSNGCSSLIRTPPSAFDPQDLADAEVSIYALISKEDLT